MADEKAPNDESPKPSLAPGAPPAEPPASGPKAPPSTEAEKAAPADPAAAKPAYCRDKARILVHKYAAIGTVWAAIPIPIATSPGLTAMETHLIYWIAKIYGESPSHTETLMIASGLELASVGLKTLAIEAANFVPVIGWGIKAAIAGSAIEGLGALVIKHFEDKHPGKLVSA